MIYILISFYICHNYDITW